MHAMSVSGKAGQMWQLKKKGRRRGRKKMERRPRTNRQRDGKGKRRVKEGVGEKAGEDWEKRKSREEEKKEMTERGRDEKLNKWDLTTNIPPPVHMALPLL